MLDFGCRFHAIFRVDFGVGFWLDFGWVRGVLTLNPTRWGRVGLRFLPSRVGPQIYPFWLHFGSPLDMQNRTKKLTKIDKKRNVFFFDFWKDFGGQMRCLLEPKSRLKINVFFVVFLNASGNIDGASTGPRRVLDGSSSGTLSPAEPPGRRHLSKNSVQYY